MINDDTPIAGLLLFLSCLEYAVQAGSGNLQCPADIHNQMAGVIELLGNAPFLDRQDCRPAALLPSGAGCG